MAEIPVADQLEGNPEVKRFFKSLVATIGLAGMVALVGAAPAGAAEPDEPVVPIYDCTITPEAPGGLSELNDVAIPIDISDVIDPVAPGATAEYDVNLQLPNIGPNPGLNLIGVMKLDVELPRPAGLASVAVDVGGTPNPPLSTWGADVSQPGSFTVGYQSPAYPNFNTGLQIQLTADGDFLYPFGLANPAVVPPTVGFSAVTTPAQAGTELEWTAPSVTAELAVLGNQHDLVCTPQVPSTVIVSTDVCPLAGFTDVSIGNQFYCDIAWMNETGISTGFQPGPTYKPSAAVSRQAMSAFMYRLAGEPVFAPSQVTFGDVTVNHPFYEEIEWMASEGITTGTPASPKPLYKPSSPVSRGAMAAFMYRFADEPVFAPTQVTFGDVTTGHPFYDEIEWMAAEGISTGTPASPKPLYKPANAVSRQAMSAFMHRLQPLLVT